MLQQVKKKAPSGHLTDALAQISLAQLMEQLNTDQRKRAFWINCYNAYFQLLRTESGLQPPDIYRAKVIRIAGVHFSLDNLEHGILRRYRLKLGLGYLPNPLASSLVKKLAVKKLDARIHFALNCGARSCPPIGFYSTDQIEVQLEQATLAFLEAESTLLPDKKVVQVTRLFLWYLGDFGGWKGVRRLLKEKLGMDTRGLRLVLKPYDWTEQLDNYS
ncbi:MAG: DUF547 domain-containing protein [Lewinellaceae bacterium]|nr:DUF547 domain-containing protein [Lewinellaceae bacterium]